MSLESSPIIKKSPDESDLLPDYRLAQVFDFTAADLAANRNGFSSWGQRYGLGRRGQRWIPGWFINWFLATDSDAHVLKICGRIDLQLRVEEVGAHIHRQVFADGRM